MRKNLTQAVLLFVLFFLEIQLLFRFKTNLIGLISFLGNSGENNYDEIVINLIGSIAFSILQIINLFLTNTILNILDRKKLKFVSRIFHCSLSQISESINRMMTFILSTDCHWGSTQHTNKIKAANTAEGLIACAYAQESGHSINQSGKDIIKKCADNVLAVLEEEGYKIYPKDAYTVHGTGMILFALYKISEAGLYEISNQNEEKIRKSLKHLLDTANQYGWQFENKQFGDTQRARNISTLWALRALNAWGYSGHKKYYEILESITNNNRGLLGFSCNGEARSSVTALLYTLVNEIQNERTKDLILRSIEKKQILCFLIKSLHEEAEFENIEIITPNHQSLPWTHLSSCMSYEALSTMIDDMNIFQTIVFSYNLGKMLKRVDVNHNYYNVHSMSFNHTNPFIYPTTYLLMALCKIQKEGK